MYDKNIIIYLFKIAVTIDEQVGINNIAVTYLFESQ